MMNTSTILIVDDSQFACRILEKALSDIANIRVVGLAHNGQEALLKIHELQPDLVILDIEMPIMDGIDTLKALRHLASPPIVLLVSALTKMHAEITIEALLLGASDYICKPTHQQSFTVLKEHLREKITSLLHRRRSRPLISIAPKHLHTSVQPSPHIIAIAASTGGPDALKKILSSLPENFLVPIVIVQHMAPLFTNMLTKSLDRYCPLPIYEATNDTELRSGTVWIAQGGHHLLIEKKENKVYLKLSDAPKVNSCRPAADLLFQSVAKVYGSHCLGIVLTGMGQDGLEGARAICQAGGTVLAQDEKSSVVWGMPRAVLEADLGAQKIALLDIAEEIQSRCKNI